VSAPEPGTTWPGGALPPTNAEQYAAAKAALDRVYDTTLSPEATMDAIRDVETALAKRRTEVVVADRGWR
jgi:hypothetical protein